MGIESGAQLGQYRLEEKIGEGGMGVVWKATDTRLNREVAVKFLPESFAGHPERLERFNREARVLASLNHPHIAGIFGLEEYNGAPFLVMELVPGSDLAQRIKLGSLPVEEALEAGRQIADALEAAHENGVIHRDLKPANVQLGPDGTVKVLDFGLAKALETDSGSGSASMSPTLTTPATLEGAILGTAAYMSPEQAKGKPVDRRADIWAFGVVLVEMLTGMRPYRGDGVSETLASVIMSTPELDALPAATPAAVRRLIERCLEKDPRRRLRDIGEARFVLEEALAGRDGGTASDAVEAGPAARRGVSPVAAAVAAVVVATLAAGAVWLTRPSVTPDAPTRRFRIAVQTPQRGSSNGLPVVISPDGTRVAYIVDDALWIRRLDRLEAEKIETAGDLHFVFWSPDSRWLGFAAGNGLWKVRAEGGDPQAILDQAGALTGGSGAAWTEDDRIVLARGDDGLYEVPARGGDLEKILEVDVEVENDFHQPAAVPGGRGVVFVSHLRDGRPTHLDLLVDGERRTLLDTGGPDIWDPTFAASGHILFRRQPANAGVWALPFSLDSLTATGEPFLVVPGGDLPSVSNDGTLVHVSGSRSRLTRMVWIDRDGEVVESVGPPQEQWPFPSLSPDRRLAAIPAAENERWAIWIHDLERGTRTMAAADTPTPSSAEWAPDGRSLLFSGSTFALFRQTIGDLAARQEIGTGYQPTLTPDGRTLLTTRNRGGNDFDISYRSVDAPVDEWTILFAAPELQVAPRVSPDGKHVVYASDENGTLEVYMREFPGGDGLWQVSVNGGTWPRWSDDGRRIYYVAGNTIHEVDLDPGPPLRLSRPRKVVERQPLGWSLLFGWPPGFDVSADGERFLICVPVSQDDAEEGIVVVENWTAELDSP